MILPWLNGFIGPFKSPMAWTFVFLNLFIYMILPSQNKRSNEAYFHDEVHLRRLGNYYAQYQSKTSDPEALKTWGKMTLRAQQYLGARALSDQKFLKEFFHFDFKGDGVAIEEMKQQIDSIQLASLSWWSQRFGLSSGAQSPLAWITYQFMHASFIHLISNMVLFLIFAIAIERLWGGLVLTAVSILSGLGAGWAFINLQESSTLPVVGASGAVTGLMSFYILTESKRNIEYFYFFSPFEGHFGSIFLPRWLLAFFFLLPDLTGYLSAEPLRHSIAYSAHLGGALTGLVLGCCWLGFSLLKRHFSLNAHH